MKIAIFLAVSALLFGCGVAQQKVECPGAADPSCNAFASLEILVTAGKCSGEAKADCAAVSQSQNAFKEAYDEWWGGEGGDACNGGKAEAAATAVATAIAEVWANAASKVQCDGRGFACGWSIANGNTYALGFAEALAQAAADAADGDLATAFCFADVRAVSTALAEAAAKAQSDVCVTDTGKQEDYQESYVQAVKVAIANAFASATARACNKGDEVVAESECKGDATAETEEEITKAGDVCGGASQLIACTGKGASMCCASDFNRGICRCEDCDGPWIKKSKEGDQKKVYENRSSQQCFCLDTADEGGDKAVDDTEAATTTQEEEAATTTQEEEAATTTQEEEATTTTQEEEATDTTTDTTAATAKAEEEQVADDGKEAEEEAGDAAVDTTTDDTQVDQQTDEGTEEAQTVPPVETGPAKAPVECPGAVDTSCNAFATLEILVTSGTCSGKATASCEAINESQSDFKDAFEEWWSEDGASCDNGKAEAAATAVATAIAKVWANAAVQVTCEGRGFACGWSASGGEAWAAAFAEAVAQAAAEASDPHGQANAFCFADVRAITAVVADAAAAAQADACTTGGTKEDFEDSFAVAIQVGIAEAFAHATASACVIGGEVTAESECKGEGTSTVEGENEVIGNACAGTKQLESCHSSMKACCDKGNKRRICKCKEGGCKDAPWIRATDWDDEKGVKRSFSNRKKAICFCLD